MEGRTGPLGSHENPSEEIGFIKKKKKIKWTLRCGLYL
jgi:hypothetical protein